MNNITLQTIEDYEDTMLDDLKLHLDITSSPKSSEKKIINILKAEFIKSKDSTEKVSAIYNEKLTIIAE